MASLSPLLVFVALLFQSVGASVHEYTAGEKFSAKGNAFVLHGGSEGIYASVLKPNNASDAAAGNGDSFIR